MICLKNRTFAVSQTTSDISQSFGFWLWFAWKIVLLQYRKQLHKILYILFAVVICLKNRTFAVSQTTRWLIRIKLTQLWFAWKIVLLQYRKQHNFRSRYEQGGCDLLEKSYFCSIANNLIELIRKSITVVICLKNRTFAVSQTTCSAIALIFIRLWFAWKIVLLQYRKQQAILFCQIMACCDLLEKSYFCSIANNDFKWSAMCVRLWFAWKIVLLQYRKQLY